MLLLMYMTMPSRIHPNGFTFIELLITLTIIAIISIAGFINIQSLRNDEELKSTVADLKSNLSLTYTNAIANVKCGNNNSTGWEMEFSRTAGVETVNISCLYAAGESSIKSYQFKGAKLKSISTPDGSTNGCSTGDESNFISTNLVFSALTGALTRTFTTNPIGCDLTKQDQFKFTITKEVNNITAERCVWINQNGTIWEDQCI